MRACHFSGSSGYGQRGAESKRQCYEDLRVPHASTGERQVEMSFVGVLFFFLFFF